MRRLTPARDRAGHLPGRLLPHQGAGAPRGQPRPARALRRRGARRDRRAAHAQGRGPQDRQPGGDPGLQQAGHLRGRARAPDLEPLGLRHDAHPGGDRDGAPPHACRAATGSATTTCSCRSARTSACPSRRTARVPDPRGLPAHAASRRSARRRAAPSPRSPRRSARASRSARGSGILRASRAPSAPARSAGRSSASGTVSTPRWPRPIFSWRSRPEPSGWLGVVEVEGAHAPSAEPPRAAPPSRSGSRRAVRMS